MIKQVEEIRPESQALTFAELERLVQSEIHILLRRANDAVARRVAVECPIAHGAVRKGRVRVGSVRQGIDPVGQSRFRAAMAGSIAATEPRAERGG